ncbi:MAG: winged helix-turn-helix domain-containing protein [Thermoplasmata archaeon]
MISRELLGALARKGRIEIIRTLRSFPGRDFTINELARTARIPAMTAWRATRELKEIGFLRARKVGNSTIVSIVDDPHRLRMLRLIPDTDPQRTSAILYANTLAQHPWLRECRLFGTVGRGEHAPGEEVDVAVVYDDGAVSESEVKMASRQTAEQVKIETNITVVPLCIPQSEMGRRGGLAAELRERETIWKR